MRTHGLRAALWGVSHVEKCCFRRGVIILALGAVH